MAATFFQLNNDEQNSQVKKKSFSYENAFLCFSIILIGSLSTYHIIGA